MPTQEDVLLGARNFRVASRLASMSFREAGDAFVPDDADSGICALASTSTGLPLAVCPRASQTGPLEGQNSFKGIVTRLSMPSFARAALSLNSR